MTPKKKAKRIYRAVTARFVVTMMLAGVASNVEGITHLGYPMCICKILGVAKELAASRSYMDGFGL